MVSKTFIFISLMAIDATFKLSSAGILFRRYPDMRAPFGNSGNSSRFFVEQINSETECTLYCKTKSECISVNYCAANKTCELINNRMHFIPDQSYGTVHLKILTETSKGVFMGRCNARKISSGIIQDCTSLQLTLKDCTEYLNHGYKENGFYKLQTSLSASGFVSVFCDMVTNGGGWIIFQKRFDGSVEFQRNLKEYADGFGDLNGEFWLGLRFISYFSRDAVELRVDLKARNGSWLFRQYNSFMVKDRKENFKLSMKGDGYGTLENALNIPRHNLRPFSTYDNDLSDGCVAKFKGSWWYGIFSQCHRSNLNGLYGSNGYGTGLTWLSQGYDYYHSFDSTEMKIRPVMET